MKNKKFIDCYKKWINTGKIPEVGLCRSLPKYLKDSEEFKIISPTIGEVFNHCNEGGSFFYWGVVDSVNEKLDEFTSFRQTIILLCACMRDEY